MECNGMVREWICLRVWGLNKNEWCQMVIKWTGMTKRLEIKESKLKKYKPKPKGKGKNTESSYKC
jgi:hypothetical protein